MVCLSLIDGQTVYVELQNLIYVLISHILENKAKQLEATY